MFFFLLTLNKLHPFDLHSRIFLNIEYWCLKSHFVSAVIGVDKQELLHFACGENSPNGNPFTEKYAIIAV
jgi:hypothetical protein